MTRQLVEAFDTPLRQHYRTTQALHFVCGALMAYDAAGGLSPYRGLDVERVISAVQMLAERSTLEVTPFVSAWHPAVSHWDQSRAMAPAFFDSRFRRAVIDPRFGGSIYDLLQTLTNGADQGTGEVYRRLAEEMITELRRLLIVPNGAADYLIPLVASPDPSGVRIIATLNYDLSIEQAAAAASIDIDTGISTWAAQRALTWPNGAVRLLKLHGSIDWRWAGYERANGHMPRSTVVADDASDAAPFQPAVLFGHRGKLQPTGPFLALLAEFERALNAADELLVVGYSFRDEHINEAIRQWTGEDAGRSITIVDPSFPQGRGFWGDKSFRNELITHLNPFEGGPEQWEPRVTVVHETAGAALPRLFAAVSGRSADSGLRA